MGMQLVPYDKQPAGERVLARNLASNPSFEVASGEVVVRENLYEPTARLTLAIAGSLKLESSSGYVGFAYQVTPGETYSIRRQEPLTNRFQVGFLSEPPDTGVDVNRVLDTPSAPVAENIVVPAGATYMFVYVANNNVIPEMLVEKSAKAGPYFDKDSLASGDFTYRERDGGGAQEVAQGVAGVTNYDVLSWQSNEWASSGSASLRIRPTGPNGGSAVRVPFSFAEGKTYTVLAKFRLDTPQVSPNTTSARSIRLPWPNVIDRGPIMPNEPGVYDYRWVFTASANSSVLQLWNGDEAGGADCWWDDLLIAEGEYTGEFFWKDTPDHDPIHYRKESDGTVTKYEQLYTPVDENAMPSVEVFLSDIDPEVSQATIWRTNEGRQHPVRGALKASVVGALSRIDYETPFNIPSTYRAEFFDANGDSMGYSEPATITLKSEHTWLHNPLAPAGAVRARALETTSRALSRPVPGEVSYPLGRRVGVVLSEPRRGLEGEVYDVYVDSIEDANKVQALIGDYNTSLVPVVCIRVGGFESRMRIPKPLFLSVFDIVEEDISIRLGKTATVHRMEGDEVDPPSAGIFIPLLTRADLNTYYQTRAALNADNQTRADVNRRYDLAGYAEQ